jgi:hypothetical protein
VRLTRRALLNGLAGGVTAAAIAGESAAAGVVRAAAAQSTGHKVGAASASQPAGRIVRTAAGESRSASSASSGWTSIVVGAGVFGAWTAWNLLRKGERVLLLDAWGPAHARASSGGESRITRTAYGADEIYTKMA